MLKQKPNSYDQSSIFAKKPKKRSTSTSANKENLSISHNNSSSMQPNNNMNSKPHLNTKSTKNPILNKQKSKKTKKPQTRQRSTSKLSSVTNNLVGEQNKILATKIKECQGFVKRTKKSRNNSSSMILVDNSHPHSKGLLKDHSELLDIKNTKYSSVLNGFHPEMSKSSTIFSSSTGNIQFSELSKEDQHDKNYDLLSINHLACFGKSSKPSVRQEYCIKSGRNQLTVQKLKLNPTRAAIMIQKTWRGYLTRRLLEEYIDSFEPMYEEQLKDIRSGRQSRQEARSMISSNRKCHQKSSFFDRSQIEECSQIQPIDSHVSQSFRTTKMQNQQSSLFSKQNDNVQQSLRDLAYLKQSFKKISDRSRGKEQIYDLPVQFFKKPVVVSNNKREQQSNKESNNDEFSCSSRRKNAMKITPETASRVSEFTVKHTAPTTSNKQQPSIQQTMKYPPTFSHNPKHFTLSICSKTTTLSISPQKLSLSDQLSETCSSLSTLFHCFNSTCINELKAQVKLNKLSVNELMERKDGLKDIVDNGMEFVKNVQDEIAKAFDEMKRIVKEGSQSDRTNNAEESELESHNQDSTERSNIPKTIKPKQESSSPENRISNEKYMQDLQSPEFSQYDSQMNSSSSGKYKKGRKPYQSAKSGTSQFYTIELPTEQYSVKGKSPIQQDYDEQDNNSSYKQDQHSHQDHLSDQQSYTEPTLRMHPLYASHQQSLQILNQFLLNLIEEYQEISSTKNVSELQYLCETLKRVSCDRQNKTIIDRCLIEFIVEIMSETWTLKEIYDGFRKIVQLGIKEQEEDQQKEKEQQHGDGSFREEDYGEDWKLLQTIRRWIEELYKWEMNIIQQVPSKMQSSSFINTQNISFNTENLSLNELRQAVNNLSNPANFQLDLNIDFK